MRFDQIRPFVRFARIFSPAAANCGRFVVMQDCRLFLLHSGASTIATGGREYAMEPGDCLYIPAGQPYRLSMPERDRPEYYILNFDFTWEHSAVDHTIPELKDPDAGIIHVVPELENAPFFKHELFFPKLQRLEPMLQELARENIAPRLFSDVRLSAQMISVLTELARAQLSERPGQPEAVETMIRYIHANHILPLRNEDIAAQVNYHPNYANSLFLRHTGHTLHQYLIDCRVQRALELLLSTEMSITDVAMQVGFSSLSRFTKEFSARTGYSPSCYRSRRK